MPFDYHDQRHLRLGALTRIAGRVMLKGHTQRVSVLPGRSGPQFHHAQGHHSDAVECEAIRGDKAMWIVLYVATIASLRAMGLAFVPVETDKERGPYSDM
jgi:hypothetical protein